MKLINKWIFIVSSAIVLSCNSTESQQKEKVKLPYEPPKALTEYVNLLDDSLKTSLLAPEEDMQWWLDAQFGFFIHWNPSSVMDLGPISWARFGPRPGHPKEATKGTPVEVYDNLYKEFNPIDFDAEEWVDIVKASGAKYLIFTAKHHDGFCMFNSEVTDYDIMNTPFKRDVCKEIADACHKKGIKIFWYYSQPDWHHPDYFTDNHESYVRDYLYVQIRELLTNYGKIDGMWFDGLGKHPDTWYTAEMLKMVRELQPGILVNHRIGPKDWRMGDFDGPEREIGHFQVNRPWETCTTIGGTWGWGGNVAPMSYKSAIHLLTNCAGNGGNLALNTGPDSKGVINPSHTERYKEIGGWLKQYGESIYATEAGPYIGGPWGVSTQKPGKIYLHILASWSGGQLTFPALPVKVKAAKLLKGGIVEFVQDEHSFSVSISSDLVNPVSTIVELDVDDQTGFIHPIQTMPEDKITIGAQVVVSSGEETAGNIVAKDNLEFMEGAFVKSTWKSDRKDSEPWAILKLKEKSQFDQIMLSAKHAYGQTFNIEAIDENGSWVIISEGVKLDEFVGIILDEVIISDQIRIKFEKLKKGVQIRSLNMYNSADI